MTPPPAQAPGFPAAPTRPARSRSRVAAAAVAVLLLLHYALAVGSKLHECVTSDELAHVTAGYTYWALDDYRLQPENGILPQRWEGLPAWIARTPFPTFDKVGWSLSDVWVTGYRFFYRTGHDHFPMLMAARAMAALFSVGVGLLVFLWSRRLFGTAGAFTSLALFTFAPEFLANGGLATSDVCLCLFMLASVGAWWRHLHAGRGLWTAVSAASFALACVAKFSCVLIPPMLALLAVVRLASPAPLRLFGRTARSKTGQAGLIALSAALHAAVAWAVIWAFFGFRYAAFNPALPPAEHFIRPWPTLDPHLGATGRVIHALMRVHALPEAFLYGLAYVIDTAQIRAAFLNGTYSIAGWVSFFPWAFALKTTLPLLVACVGMGVIAGGRWARAAAARAPGASRLAAGTKGALRDLYRVAPLAVLFAVYWAVSICSHLNIGHRHLLPTYPVLYIGAGCLAYRLNPRRLAPLVAVGGLLAWQAAECAYVAPHFLAYFNELAGGPAGGRYHLADSSLDWGQDLPGLKQWLGGHARPGETVYLAYFGNGNPDYYKIDAWLLDTINGFHLRTTWEKPKPGLYCIGATMLDQVYGTVRGPWTRQDEGDYQAMVRMAPVLEAYEHDPAARAGLDRRNGPIYWWQAIDHFNKLQLARLCYYLRVRQPDASVGWSIYIYRLNQAEVDAALGPSVRAWSDLIERTVAAGGRPDGGRP